MPTMSRRRFVNVMGSVGATAAVSQVTPAWGFAATAVGATSQAGSSDALAFKTAVELARMIRDKEISSVELTRYKLLDRRTDIWSFGCVLYEVLTGKGAFLGRRCRTPLRRSSAMIRPGRLCLLTHLPSYDDCCDDAWTRTPNSTGMWR